MSAKAVVLCVGVALAAVVSVSALAAVDQGRKNDADAALVKAQALLQAAGSDRAGHVSRAIADITAARNELKAMPPGS